MSKQSLWPIVLEQCNVCMTYAATLCNPFAPLMKVGEGRERRTVYDNICFFDM